MTKPVVEIVALATVADTHALEAAAVPEPVNCEVLPIHAVKVPVIVGVGLMTTSF